MQKADEDAPSCHPFVSHGFCMGRWGLQCSYNVKKFRELTYIYLREVVVLELVKVAVIAHDVCGPCDDSTVHELIVIRVGGDKVEAISGINVLDVRSLHQFLHHCVGDKGVVSLYEYL